MPIRQRRCVLTVQRVNRSRTFRAAEQVPVRLLLGVDSSVDSNAAVEAVCNRDK
jgi:hypothetical protein